MYVRKGFVEWDLVVVSLETEASLWEVGVRAAVLRKEAETCLLAPFVRGVDIKWAEAFNREMFNKLVYRDAQVIRVDPRVIITRDQVKTAMRRGVYIELSLKTLIKDLPLLKEWLEVLEPEAVIFSTSVETPLDVKSPLDLTALLVEISGDKSWAAPILKSLDILVELVVSK
ncbi:MAG: hypothetical protein QXK71_01895 [Pyrobaculum sp.]|jgi:hypothetical protein